MKLTVGQELALKDPYDMSAAARMEKSGPSVHHMSTRWISSEVQVLVIFTVGIPDGAPPFWHVSMSVKVRDTGTMHTAGLSKPMRRRLRDIGYDVLRGVGCPADADDWSIEEKAVHLMRNLTDDELTLLEEADRA